MDKETLAVVWVDTEDFITPESDDAALLLAKTFEKHGIKVNFKLVGEEVRQLQKRKRGDVIAAVSRHDVGYHSNLHSVHPTISEYVGDLGWDEGVTEWENRERIGFEELKKAIGRTPACYGHPGASWVPQVYPVMMKWNVPVYLDDMETISAKNEKPYYLCNTLNLQGFGPNVMCLDGPPSSANLPPDHLTKLPDRLKGILNHLETTTYVPLIGMYCHPNSYATEEFWDMVNFNRGKNPEGFKSVDNPGKLRKPKLKSPETIKDNVSNLEKFLAYASSIKHLHFITASQAAKIYKDKSVGRNFSRSEIQSLSEKCLDSINYQTVGDGVWLNAAEIYYMILYSLAHYSKTKKLPNEITPIRPLGPKADYQSNIERDRIDLQKFLEACVTEEEKIRNSGYISNHVVIGKTDLSPIDMFATCAQVYLSLARDEKMDTTIAIRTGNFEVGNLVTEKGAIADWSYYFLPPNFRAPMQVKIARLQTWTYKPAVADISQIHQA